MIPRLICWLWGHRHPVRVSDPSPIDPIVLTKQDTCDRCGTAPDRAVLAIRFGPGPVSGAIGPMMGPGPVSSAIGPMIGPGSVASLINTRDR